LPAFKSTKIICLRANMIKTLSDLIQAFPLSFGSPRTNVSTAVVHSSLEFSDFPVHDLGHAHNKR
jgi:hypothetical protein